MRDDLQDWLRFLRVEAHTLVRDPARLFPQAANQPDATAPARAALRRWESGAERRPWLRWVNKPQALSSCLAVLAIDGASLRSCDFSADGRRIAGMDGRGTLRIWNVETGVELAAIEGHAWAFSPDGARIASALGLQVVFWDAVTGAPLHEAGGLRVNASEVVFSPDGKRLLVAEERTLHLRNARTGAAIARLEGHERTVTACAFSPDGTRIASGALGGGLKLWDGRRGRLIAELSGHTKAMYQCVFSPDGRVLASASRDGTVRLWDAGGTGLLGFWRVSRREPLATCAHGGWVRAVAFSPDGTRLVSASDNELAKVWDVATGAEIACLRGHSGIVSDCLFLDGGARVLTGGYDGTLRTWDAASGACLGTFHGHRDEVLALDLSPDESRIASASGDGTIRIWDPRGHADTHVHLGDIESCAITPDGSRFVAGSRDGTATLWSAESGRVIATLRHRDREYVTGCAFSPDGSLLATASTDETIRLWDGVTGAELMTITGRSQRIRVLVFTPDGSRLVGGYQDGVIRLLGPRDGAEMALLRGHRSMIQDLAFSPDGRLLVSVAHASVPKVWDLASASEVCTLAGNPEFAETCRFSPDGTRLASAGHDGKARIWNMPGGVERAVMEMVGNVEDCDFSPDGRLIATGSAVQGVMLWDGDSGNEIAMLSDREQWVGVTRFSPDGAHLFSVSNHGVMTLWDVASRSPRVEFGGVNLTMLSGRDSTVRWSASGRRILVGTRIGDVHLLELMNLPSGPPFVSPAVLFRIDSASWDDEPSVVCGWCGRRVVVPQAILERLTGDRPVDASCPECGATLRFNPFVVDGRPAA
ncbi:MAG: WD40 repeat domain-containing protein [Gemmatimonadales bacterium]